MHRYHVLAAVTGVSFLSALSPAAVTITTPTIQSIASSTPFPGTSGTHFHSSLGLPTEVGSYSTSEEVRGAAEVDVTGQAAAKSATINITVARIGSSYYNQTGPGSYTINVVAYPGDNSITLADYSAASTFNLGSFNTANITLNQVLSFDVTAAYNAALQQVIKSLGIRLQLGSAAGTNVANQFSNYTLVTDAPEPASLTGLALAVAGATLKRRRA